MKLRSALLAVILAMVTVLTGCERLMVLNPAGPQAERQANDIVLSIILMSAIVLIIFAILVFMLIKYRASKQSEDYEPPHIEGSPVVESIVIGIPVLIIIFLSIVSVQSNYIVEAAPKGYEDQKPLVVYASSSNWKWHFSYPEEDIETVNYLYIPTDRALEFKLYSYGPITSFWVPQLGGQKYAMADMVNTLHLAADIQGDYFGRNANFSGKGFAENTFNVRAVSPDKFDEWVEEVKATAKPLTESEFDKLLEPGHLGQMTFTGTHLDFSPPPDGHQHGSSSSSSDSEEVDDTMHEDTHEDTHENSHQETHDDSHEDTHEGSH